MLCLIKKSLHLLRCLGQNLIAILAQIALLFTLVPAYSAPQSAAKPAIVQYNIFETGMDDKNNSLTIPSIDPAGVTYHAPTGHLFIADSEINEIDEVWEIVQANVFEVSLDGKILYASYNLGDEKNSGTKNKEPTGIAYSDFDGFFYVTNDNQNILYRYERVSQGDKYILRVQDRVNVLDFPETAEMEGDWEGVSVDPHSGLIYVVDGFEAEIIVFRYTTRFEFIDRIPAHDESGKRIRDPEGIAISPINNHIFLVSVRQNLIAEFTENGEFLRAYPLESLNPLQIDSQGLTFAPPSNPVYNNNNQLHLYIADGRVDNDDDPTERDGIIYEVYATLDQTEANDKRSEIARGFSLHQNYPNPFNANTNITFDLLIDANVSIKLYTTMGEEIATIANDFYNPGIYTVLFEPLNLPSGMYFYKMRIRGSAQTKSLIILK